MLNIINKFKYLLLLEALSTLSYIFQTCRLPTPNMLRKCHNLGIKWLHLSRVGTQWTPSIRTSSTNRRWGSDSWWVQTCLIPQLRRTVAKQDQSCRRTSMSIPQLTPTNRIPTRDSLIHQMVKCIHQRMNCGHRREFSGQMVKSLISNMLWPSSKISKVSHP